MKEFKDILRRYAPKDIMSIIEDPPAPFFDEQLRDTSFVVGNNFSLQCKLNKLYSVIWLKDGAKLTDKSVKIEAIGYNHKITITKTTKSCAGQYACKCGEAETTCKAVVEVQTATFEVQLSDLNIEVGQTVTLTCKLNKDLPVSWYKAQDKVKTNQKVEITNSNGIHVLTIRNAQTNDSGVYSCSSDDDNTVCSVAVEGRIVQQIALLIEQSNDNVENFRKANVEIHDLKIKTKEYETDIAKLKETVNCLQSELDKTHISVKMQVDALNNLQQSPNLTNDTARIETELEKAKKDLKDQSKLEEDLNNLRQNIDFLNAQVDDKVRLEKELESAKRELKKMESKACVIS